MLRVLSLSFPSSSSLSSPLSPSSPFYQVSDHHRHRVASLVTTHRTQPPRQDVQFLPRSLRESKSCFYFFALRVPRRNRSVFFSRHPEVRRNEKDGRRTNVIFRAICELFLFLFLFLRRLGLAWETWNFFLYSIQVDIFLISFIRY